jgi:radical SAM-linked protein
MTADSTADSTPDSTGPPPVADPAVPLGPVPAPVFKYRLRFRKDGSLRWLSHHDLLRTFERMLRRAELPFRCTQGFHPHPRLVFALSLPLGVIGQAEVVELELTEPLPPEEVSDRLRRQTPPGLTILEVRSLPPRAAAHVRALTYAAPVLRERVETVRLRIAEVLAAGVCQVERTRPPRRFLDIRPFLRNLRLEEVAGEPDRMSLVMELWLTPAGTARPEEVLTVLGLGDLGPDGSASAVLERTRLELEDEQPSLEPAEGS